MNLRRPRTVLAIFLVALTTVVATAFAQGRRGRRFSGDITVEQNPRYDGRFAFVRLRYQGYGCMSNEGPGWMHDYPIAERNLMKILGELTALQPRLDSSYVLDTDDPELMRHPIAYLSEPGCWRPTESEVTGLQQYLQKGGFLIVDDFRGQHWYNFAEVMSRVLPGLQFVELDVTNPVFQSMLGIETLDLSEPNYGGRSLFMGLYEDNDPAKRLLVVANYNNDIGDYWQWSAEGFLPIPLTNEAYKLGVNYIMYGFSH
ncbi:MAG TPA: DUF4159 domain-containing protein [Gemmatimonadaceae bacterium]|nr:DUF4159 domain-containing protein [Gemmatimonadaceae bacterium]